MQGDDKQDKQDQRLTGKGLWNLRGVQDSRSGVKSKHGFVVPMVLASEHL